MCPAQGGKEEEVDPRVVVVEGEREEAGAEEGDSRDEALSFRAPSERIERHKQTVAEVAMVKVAVAMKALAMSSR